MKLRYGNDFTKTTFFYETLFFYLILGMLSWFIFSIFMRGTFFTVNQIEVIGNHTISAGYIEQASGIQIGDSIFGVRSWEIEKRIKKINDIKSVEIQKVFPHIVQIKVVERKPLVRVFIGDSSFCVDEQGVRVNCPSTRLKELVALYIPSNRNDSIQSALEVILTWLNEFDTSLSRIKMANNNLFILQLQNDIFIKCESAGNLKEKVPILKPLLREVQVKSLKVVGFDLRMKKDIVVIQNEEEIF